MFSCIAGYAAIQSDDMRARACRKMPRIYAGVAKAASWRERAKRRHQPLTACQARKTTT